MGFITNSRIRLYTLPKFLGGHFLFWFPGFVKNIISLFSNENWLVHNLNLDNESSLYSPEVYLSNKKIYNRKYTLIIDTNIYDFLLKNVKRQSPNLLHRKALALLIFCQLSEIEIDPFFSVLERLKDDNVDDVLQDLYLFQKLNNSDANILAKYATGSSVTLELNNEVYFSYATTREKLIHYKKRDEWKSLYLMILKIVEIYSDNTITYNNKLCFYTDWLVKEFRLGVPCIVFASVLFGKKPLHKMMKYKNSDNRDEKIKKIKNMTWDLFILRYFFIKWQEKKENEEFIFASSDKAFRELLRLTIQIYQQKSF